MRGNGERAPDPSAGRLGAKHFAPDAVVVHALDGLDQLPVVEGDPDLLVGQLSAAVIEPFENVKNARVTVSRRLLLDDRCVDNRVVKPQPVTFFECVIRFTLELWLNPDELEHAMGLFMFTGIKESIVKELQRFRRCCPSITRNRPVSGSLTKKIPRTGSPRSSDSTNLDASV